jgi:hypothetical protein
MTNDGFLCEKPKKTLKQASGMLKRGLRVERSSPSEAAEPSGGLMARG